MLAVRYDPTNIWVVRRQTVKYIEIVVQIAQVKWFYHKSVLFLFLYCPVQYNCNGQGAVDGA
jgi:hypothetical protein